MSTEAADGDWHIVVTCVYATLRRYPGQDAAAAYQARAPYDAVISAELREHQVWLSSTLIAGAALTRRDRRAIERLLRQLGATHATAERHGDVRELRAGGDSAD